MARPKDTKYIETPEKLMEYFEQYRKQTKANPIKKHVFVGKDGNADYEEREKPLTMEGFKNYCRRVIGEVEQYFMNPDNRYSDYISICRAIKDEIREDQIVGGMTMIYNPSITQRLNGLVEKTQADVSAEVNIKQITGIEIK
jgi:hypothetical protein